MVGFGDLKHRLRIKLQPLIVLVPITKVAIVEILVSDWRKKNQPRRGFAVVFLRQRVLDELIEILFEFIQTGGASKGLVVSEESKNHVRFG